MHNNNVCKTQYLYTRVKTNVTPDISALRQLLWLLLEVLYFINTQNVILSGSILHGGGGVQLLLAKLLQPLFRLIDSLVCTLVARRFRDGFAPEIFAVCEGDVRGHGGTRCGLWLLRFVGFFK